MQKQDPAPIRILIAPLDWGLGHATRCIPLIRFFLDSGCVVWIAAEGKTQQLLQQEFPTLDHVSLRGYRIRYASTRIGLVRKVTGQIPGILQTIRYEKSWLKQVVKDFALDAVVSDNRFGLHHPDIPCVYLTHQLRIKIPGGGPIEGLLQRLHYRFIQHYNACWVPDVAGKPNLSGDLGHPRRLPGVPLQYLGPLSRLVRKDIREQYSLLILLSGPEPQRTLFEEQILHQIQAIPGQIILVRGLPGAPPADDLAVPGKLVVYNHANAALLQELLAASAVVLSRTGYTTVMDMVRLRKRSILVPTPGQTEQEYLGTYLRSEGIAYTTPQAGFDLRRAMEGAAAFPYRFPVFEEEDFKVTAGAWLAHIRGLKV